MQKLTLADKINLLQDIKAEERKFSDVDKYIPHAEQLLEKALLALESNKGFNPAAYMVSYAVLTTLLPITHPNNARFSFFERYAQQFRRLFDVSRIFEGTIMELNPYFMMHKEELQIGPGQRIKQKEQFGTRAFEAVKRRIAEVVFSDSPRNIRERPKFYARFSVIDGNMPERLKEALLRRSNQELYEFRTEKTEEKYVGSYSLIYIVMPFLNLIEPTSIQDWLLIKQRNKPPE